MEYKQVSGARRYLNLDQIFQNSLMFEILSLKKVQILRPDASPIAFSDEDAEELILTAVKLNILDEAEGRAIEQEYEAEQAAAHQRFESNQAQAELLRAEMGTPENPVIQISCPYCQTMNERQIPCEFFVCGNGDCQKIVRLAPPPALNAQTNDIQRLVEFVRDKYAREIAAGYHAGMPNIFDVAIHYLLVERGLVPRQDLDGKTTAPAPEGIDQQEWIKSLPALSEPRDHDSDWPPPREMMPGRKAEPTT